MRCRIAARRYALIPIGIFKFSCTVIHGTISRPEVAAAFKACGILKDVEIAAAIAAARVGDVDRYVLTAIIDAYSRCGEVAAAREFFDDHIQCCGRQDVAPWNAMVMGYVRNGKYPMALEIFSKMEARDGRSFVAGLAACSCMAADEQGEVFDGKVVKKTSLKRGMAVYLEAVDGGYDDIFVANAMVDLCGRCGDLLDARKIFDKMEFQDVVSWTSLILVYVENDEEEIALELLESMGKCGCSPNSRTFVAGLIACSKLALKSRDGRPWKSVSLEKGRFLHRRAVEGGCDRDAFVASALIDMYTRCGSLEEAENAFVAISPCRDPVPWNALIQGCVLSGENELALEKFQRMKEQGCVPNARTYVAALMACSSMAAKEGDRDRSRCLGNGAAIHSEAAKAQCDSDAFVASALVEMYAKSGSMDNALAVFRKMVPSPTVAAWNSMILGFVASGESDRALKFFSSMEESKGGKPDTQSFIAAIMAVSSLAAKEEDCRQRKNLWLQRGIDLHQQAGHRGCDSDVYVACTLLDMYSKCGCMDRARKVFDKNFATAKDTNPVALNTLLLGYAENGEPDLALELFERHEQSVQLNERTFVAAMVACSYKAEAMSPRRGGTVAESLLEEGRLIHSRARKKQFDDNIFVANSLVDFYVKCGSMSEARAVFDSIAARTGGRRSSPVGWNSMISGYAASGDNELALKLFDSMKAGRVVKPDARTYVAALSACSNLVAVQSGAMIHAEICRHGLEGQEFVASSLVDFYSKSAKMDVARHLFDSISTKSTVVWNAILAGYGCQGCASLALETFRGMIEEEVEIGSVTILSTITACSRSGLVGTGMKIFAAMESLGVQRQIEHYHCMVDLLGRANELEDALIMIRTMPYAATVVSWMTLLGGCEKWKNVEIGELAFRSIERLENNNVGAQKLMTKILACTE